MHRYVATEVVRERRQRYVHEAATWRHLPEPILGRRLIEARQVVGLALVRTGLRLVHHPPSPRLTGP